MGQNFTFISNYTVPTGSTTVTISGIPSTYSDLLVIAMVGTNDNENPLYVRPNSDSAGNKDTKGWSAYSGNAAFAPESTNQGRFDVFGGMQFSNINPVFGMNYFYIKNYSSTSVVKSMFSDNRVSGGGNQLSMFSLRYNSTSAISSIQFNPKGDGSIAQIIANSTFTLYGITID